MATKQFALSHLAKPKLRFKLIRLPPGCQNFACLILITIWLNACPVVGSLSRISSSEIHVTRQFAQ